jgi:hypothetical protein
MTAYKPSVGFLTAGIASVVLFGGVIGSASAGEGPAPNAAPQKPQPPKAPTRKAPPKTSSPESRDARPETPEVPPKTSDALTEHARLLFDAIVQGTPEIADPFFFPREPFLPLKDVDDPGRYHAELVRVYHRDILRLHAKRKSWEKARFVGFTLGSPPRWIEPGREWNKKGYYRTFDAKLAYEVSGTARTLIVRTIISWEGQWYVTHLSPVKH